MAIAAFAASTISKAEPLATGFAAVRAGIVVFTIPFVFAFYPELLLIEQAQLTQSFDGSTENTYLPGYDGSVPLGPLAWLLLRLLVSLYLVASALTKFDVASLSLPGVLLRLAIAVLVLLKVPEIAISAMVVAVLLLAFHHIRNRMAHAGP